jgi:5-methylcytosine-specific restriction endonuclease McrA
VFGAKIWMIESNYYKHKRHIEWREKVLRRDKYLCQECRKYGKRTAATHAHHIKSMADFPELRYVVANGESLCLACHNRKHPEKGEWKH